MFLLILFFNNPKISDRVGTERIVWYPTIKECEKAAYEMALNNKFIIEFKCEGSKK